MPNSIILYPHLGLGDSIICNGLVREVCKQCDLVIMIVDPIYIESVSFMYSDLHNIQFIKAHYNSANSFFNESQPKNLLVIGDCGMGRVPEGLQFDEWFYQCAGVLFEKRWDSFYFSRKDPMFPKQGEYIFVHDDDRFKITKLPTHLPIIHARDFKTKNIFDYCSLIENATEVHVIESAFLFLADSIPTKGRLFSHRYARQYPANNTPHLKKDWEILT